MVKEINLFEPTIEQSESVIEKPRVEMRHEKSVAPPPFTRQEVHVDRQDARLQIKRVIEALLFASSEPLNLEKIREVVDTIQPLPPREIRALIQSLQDDYYVQKRAFRIEEIANGFMLRACEEFHPYIELLFKNKRGEKLSQAAAEVLAIIAYRQPITRPQIEAIRGVDCSGVVQVLLERQLVQPVGKAEGPGRPTLYATTKEFLQYFELRDVRDLPNHKSIHQPLADASEPAQKQEEKPLE